jgi:DNA-binding winged helix-turn-helix (wHTH) protein
LGSKQRTAHLAIDEAHAYDVNEPVRLRFGTNELDCASRRLWRDGREVHLSTKAFDLLVLLVERRPAAVRKSEIKQRLWPETFVSETNLPTLITEIRDALGKHAREAQFIRTVHGFGYSFSAEAVIVGTAGAAPDIDAGLARLVGPTSQIALRSGENVLGREGDDVVALRSSTVSRRHARVTLSAETGTIEDIGSKNGTYVNDIRVTTPTTIADGDTIRVGSLVFTLRFAGRSTSTQTM